MENKAELRGKPPGMTEDQWNEIVQKNFSQFRNEEVEKKAKLAAQREQMKHELMNQVASKADIQANAKEAERIKHVQQLELIE